MTRITTRPYSHESFSQLCQTGVHPVLARIFAARGITQTEELSTGLSGMISPIQLAHIGDAAGFLADAIAQARRITVIADYDCDGATACAVA